MRVLEAVVLIALIAFFTWIAACNADTPYEDQKRIRQEIKEWKS